jgi:hypothetical protein
VQFAEVGGTNIGEYIASGGEELARKLGAEAEDLRALVHLPDETLARQFRLWFERRARRRAEVHAEAVQRVALTAADHLAATARWEGDAAVLDVRVLLGELLVDTSRKHVLLDATGFGSRFLVSVPRRLLVDTAKVLGGRPDVGAWVDESGLHFRWNEGRGGLNFIPQMVPAQEMATILCVNMPGTSTASRRPWYPHRSGTTFAWGRSCRRRPTCSGTTSPSTMARRATTSPRTTSPSSGP